jgi:hypothetical protein
MLCAAACCVAVCQVFTESKLELPGSVSSRPGMLPPDQLERFIYSWGQQLSGLALLLLRSFPGVGEG